MYLSKRQVNFKKILNKSKNYLSTTIYLMISYLCVFITESYINAKMYHIISHLLIKFHKIWSTVILIFQWSLIKKKKLIIYFSWKSLFRIYLLFIISHYFFFIIRMFTYSEKNTYYGILEPYSCYILRKIYVSCKHFLMSENTLFLIISNYNSWQ